MHSVRGEREGMRKREGRRGGEKGGEGRRRGEEERGGGKGGEGGGGGEKQEGGIRRRFSGGSTAFFFVLFQVVHFQILPIDPQLSLNQMFQPAPDYQQHHHGNSHRDGYEPVGEGEGEGKEASADGPGQLSCIYICTCTVHDIYMYV